MDHKFEITIHRKSYKPGTSCFRASITHHASGPEGPKFLAIEGDDFQEKNGALERRAALDHFMRALSHTLRYAAYPDDTARYEEIETPQGKKYVSMGYPYEPLKENIPNGKVEE